MTAAFSRGKILPTSGQEEVMSQIFNATSTKWTAEELEAAKQFFAKVAATRSIPEVRRRLPGLVFEGFRQNVKNVSTEGVFFNEHEEIYLIQRPSLSMKPHEPYPDMWHSPGETHGDEWNNEVFTRLIPEELGDVKILRQLGPFLAEGHDPPRGRYVLLITPTLIRGTPNADARGKFFTIRDIPWDQLVASHREKILPRAIEEAKKAGWIE